MKIILDIKENKALFIMKLLNNFSFVKARPITNEKALLLQEIKEAIDNVKLVKSGRLQTRSAKALLNEL